MAFSIPGKPAEIASRIKDEIGCPVRADKLCSRADKCGVGRKESHGYSVARLAVVLRLGFIFDAQKVTQSGTRCAIVFCETTLEIVSQEC